MTEHMPATDASADPALSIAPTMDESSAAGAKAVRAPAAVTDVRAGAPRELAILGTRGIPARHGGFETFAERLATHLVARGWRVTVYCQSVDRPAYAEEDYRGVRLVHVREPRETAWGTMVFDWKSTRHVAASNCAVLTLGYNTAAFGAWHRVRGTLNLLNMDGLEYRRSKWSRPARLWLYLNERIGCRVAHHLIADHPVIEAHLRTRAPAAKITMIPYGADAITAADTIPLAPLGLTPGGYALVVARAEPENSLLEIVRAFSTRRRGVRLLVLGRYQPDRNRYHQRVLDAAGPEVIFAGAIYDQRTVAALRLHARMYVHGHTVGGTNPALVEALGAAMPVAAHDNAFNRWVAGPEACYFGDSDVCAAAFDELLDDAPRLERMRTASRRRHAEQFTWERVLAAYETLLANRIDARREVRQRR